MDTTVTLSERRAVESWLRGAREKKGLAALPQAKRLKAQSCNRTLRQLVQSRRTNTTPTL